MVRYRAIEGHLELDGQRYSTYGIAAEEDGEIIKTIEDVSIDSADVAELVARCNEESLDVVHLEDVVNDFLATSRA